MPDEPTQQGPPPRKGGRARPTKDLDDLRRTHHVTGEFRPRESKAERESRLRIEEEKAKHLLLKEKVILVSTVLGMGVIVLACLVLLCYGPSEDKKWAMSVLAAIVSAGVGYMARGSAGKPD